MMEVLLTNLEYKLTYSMSNSTIVM